jgi:signal recognition particle subunit SRP54
MFEKLKESLSNFTSGGVDKKAIKELIKDLQRSLIQSDVNVKLVFDLSKKIEEKALSDKIPNGLTKREYVINIVYDHLVDLLGREKGLINFNKQRILLLGLFGSGKTTSSVKIANLFKSKGLSVGIIGCDTWRPAALKQLQQFAVKSNIDVFGVEKEKDPVKIVKKGLIEFKNKDVVIVDSAGRSAIDSDLSDELKKIDKVLNADEKLLVMSSDIGQSAQKQANEFNNLVGLTGVVVTKMDSSAKGGGILSACNVSDVKVKFITVGEKVNDIEYYDPIRFVSRLLGMGDLESLLEKAKDAIDPKDAMELLQKGDMNFDIFYKQLEAVNKMGSIQKILDFMPFGNKLQIPKGALDVQQEKMKDWKIIISSMSRQEKTDSEVFKDSKKSRFTRIANGSGKSFDDVRELYTHFKKTKKMMKQMKGLNGMNMDGNMDEKKMQKLLNKFKGKLPF